MLVLHHVLDRNPGADLMDFLCEGLVAKTPYSGGNRGSREDSELSEDFRALRCRVFSKHWLDEVVNRGKPAEESTERQAWKRKTKTSSEGKKGRQVETKKAQPRRGGGVKHRRVMWEQALGESDDGFELYREGQEGEVFSGHGSV
ncbi:hypothetical protein CB1_002411004 [Camelus ferus]|nr:hypothetical protein CB1_002411004 [Camelus ferus]